MEEKIRQQHISLDELKFLTKAITSLKKNKSGSAKEIACVLYSIDENNLGNLIFTNGHHVVNLSSGLDHTPVNPSTEEFVGLTAGRIEIGFSQSHDIENLIDIFEKAVALKSGIILTALKNPDSANEKVALHIETLGERVDTITFDPADALKGPAKLLKDLLSSMIEGSRSQALHSIVWRNEIYPFLMFCHDPDSDNGFFEQMAQNIFEHDLSNVREVDGEMWCPVDSINSSLWAYHHDVYNKVLRMLRDEEGIDLYLNRPTPEQARHIHRLAIQAAENTSASASTETINCGSRWSMTLQIASSRHL